MPVFLPPPPDPPDVSIVNIQGFLAKVLNDGSFRYGIDERGPARTVTYLVVDRDKPYGMRGANFCDALMGLGNYSIKPFGWPNPHRYPNNTALSCISAQAEPWGALGPDPQLGAGEFAKVVADYMIHQWLVYGDDPDASLPDLNVVPWHSLQSRGGFEEYPISGTTQTFQFKSDGVACTRTVKKVMPHVDYIFRRSMVPSLFDYDLILNGLAGTVNNGIFMGKAKGTLRLQDWDQDYSWDASGKRTQEFSMVLRWRPVDWNFELRPQTANNFALVVDSIGNPNYNYADYTLLTQYGLTGAGGGGIPIP